MVTLFAGSSQSMKINRPAACIFNCCQLFKRLFKAELVVHSLSSDNQGRRWGSHQPHSKSFPVHQTRDMFSFELPVSSWIIKLISAPSEFPLCACYTTRSAAPFLLHNSTFTTAVDASSPLLSSPLSIPLSHSDSSSFFPLPLSLDIDLERDLISM